MGRLEIVKGKKLYKNSHVNPDDYSILDRNQLMKQLRERQLTDNGMSGEQTVTERMIFDKIINNYSKYYLIEYLGGYPSQLVEISTLDAIW